MPRLWSIAALSFLSTTGVVLLGAAHQRVHASAAAAPAPSPAPPAPAAAPAARPPATPVEGSAPVEVAEVVEAPRPVPSGPGGAAGAWDRGWDALSSALTPAPPTPPAWGADRFTAELATSVPDLAHSSLDLVLGAPPRSLVYETPAWFPADDIAALAVLDQLSDGPARTGGPLRLASRAAFVWDLDAGRLLLSKNADDMRPVASLTKVVAALTVSSLDADLDAPVCLDGTTRSGWPGAASKLKRGACVSGWDLLGAALVKSDNGAAYALPHVADTPHYVFVARMNSVARELAMDQSAFADPSGADDDNLSTARDMTRAIIALAEHPELGPIASAPSWLLEDQAEGTTRQLITTNELIGRADTDILAAKTGYTDTARYCFTGVFRLANGRTVAVTTLGAGRNRDRWADLRAILAWAETEAPDAG
jgi:D-alanyl-D-alanine endopeptidase (penicillin-binding protein 7)